MSVPLRVEAKYLRERQPSEPIEDLAERLAFSGYVRTGEVPSIRAIAETLDLKFNSDQPRVPAGSPEGGQWTDGGGGSGGGQNYAPLPHGPIPALLDECWLQLEKDKQICTRLKNTFCHRQAMFRYAACLNGDPIPPFPYW